MPSYEERELRSRNRKILVVEDNEINRAILHELLKDEYDVVEATNGEQGLVRMRELCDDLSLVLLDVYMPVMDGFGFLRERQKESRLSNIPVIVATASDSGDDEIACLGLGANDFVRKPYNVDAIKNRIGNTIRLRETASMVNHLRWDAVSGLFSAEFFYQRAEALLAAYPDQAFDLVCSDIRNFKTLNERYGRDFCDDVLRKLAQGLEEAIAGVTVSGRVGGDSFAFLVEHGERDWDKVLEPAVRAVGTAHLHVRFGIVDEVEHGLSASGLCDRAISALEELPDDAGAQVGIAYYDEELHKRITMERTLVESMQQALSNREFAVHFQPKHDARTGRVAGAEALVRWIHPELGFVRPDVFVTLFERSGLIAQLDRYVLEEACREVACIERQGLPAVPVSVNMSPLDFDDGGLPGRVLEVVDGCGLDHRLVHLELTETAYAENPDGVAADLAELRSHGFKIELDDFGSGYSALALLNTLPLDVLKVDMSLIRAAERLDDYRIIQSTIQMAQLLGLETVVEGVETAEVADRLLELGCDLIQGYYYSRPLPGKEFERYLAERR